ncbi:MAG: phage holin family protein [Desulfobacteraceae bacterium]|nr:MAG: phage holin family protein [Desulfobacteraceae bacterium]
MIWNLIILSVAVFIVSSLLPGIYIKSYGTAIVVAVLYSIINFFLGWLLVILSLPFIILTLGLFTFIINAVLLWMTDKIVNDFEIKGFGTTILASLLISVTNSILHYVF